MERHSPPSGISFILKGTSMTVPSVVDSAFLLKAANFLVVVMEQARISRQIKFFLGKENLPQKTAAEKFFSTDNKRRELSLQTCLLLKSLPCELHLRSVSLSRPPQRCVSLHPLV